MADLIVQPSYQFKETDIVTVDKLNLMATPVVSLAVETPVTDENFFRNGNNYSSFWTTPTGKTCPVATETQNSNYWYVNPNGAAVTCKRSTDVPDLYSLFSLEVDGAIGATDCSVGQQINGDLSATLRRPCTFSGYIENNSGALLSPKLEIWTANAFNNFNTVTLQKTVNLQTVPMASWAYDTVTIDISTVTNAANGLFIKVRIPNGALAQATYRVNFARLKFQLGEVATNFVDDPSLFLQTPSIDSTMLQDGCIARPSLFLPNVVPTGAYQAGSIQSGDIANGTITAADMASGAAVGNLGYTPINKAGDTNIGPGQLAFVNDDLVSSTSVATAAIKLETTSANASNDGYFPAISFNRPGAYGRTLGLSTTGRYKTVDHNGTVGYLLDTVTKVDTNSYQPGSITLPALAQSLINILVPPGMVRMFGGPNIPTGWLVCDGSQVSRTTYAALFGALGTYWGAGDSITTFNLPDFRGRSPLGYVNSGVGGITGRAFASLGGEENHVLSVDELAYHNHALNDPGHSHGVTQTPHSHTYINPTGGLAAQPGSGQYTPLGATNTGAANANITINGSGANISINPAGSNYGHNNMQPFAVLYFIIKT